MKDVVRMLLDCSCWFSTKVLASKSVILLLANHVRDLSSTIAF